MVRETRSVNIKTFGGATRADVDYLTSAEFISKTFPDSYRDTMKLIEAEREVFHAARRIHDRGHTTGFTDNRDLQLAARYPYEVFYILQSIASDILEDPKEHQRWLNKHPEWKIGETIVRAT